MMFNFVFEPGEKIFSIQLSVFDDPTFLKAQSKTTV